jgi:hypothetical protein
MIYKKKLKTIRGFTKSTDLVITTKKLILKSHETVPLILCLCIRVWLDWTLARQVCERSAVSTRKVVFDALLTFENDFIIRAAKAAGRKSIFFKVSFCYCS